jgi:hypothetical protein
MVPVSQTIQPLLIATALQNFIRISKFLLLFRVVPTVPQLSFFHFVTHTYISQVWDITTPQNWSYFLIQSLDFLRWTVI